MPFNKNNYLKHVNTQIFFFFLGQTEFNAEVLNSFGLRDDAYFFKF